MKLRPQTLADSMIVELPGKIVYETRIYRIETDKHETRVTLAEPIVRDENWTQFDKGFVSLSRKGMNIKSGH